MSLIGRRRGSTLILAAFAALVLVLVLARPGRAASTDPCNPVVSVIACENSKPGTPQSQWDINGAGSSNIQGFATDISVNVGETVALQDQDARPVVPPRHLPDGLLPGQRRAADHDGPAVGDAAADAAGVPDAARHRPDRLWQLGGLGVVDGAFDRRLRYLLRQTRPHRRYVRSQPHRLRRTRTTRVTPTCSFRPRTRRGRPTTTTAATASTTGRLRTDARRK